MLDQTDARGRPAAAERDKDSKDTSFSVYTPKAELCWPVCCTSVLRAVCTKDTNHQVAKPLLCGREWCPSCGQKDSFSHKTRTSRMLRRAKQFETMNYWIIEMPIASRYLLRSKFAWREFKNLVLMVLKEFGFDRQVWRYHWFGDDDPVRRGWNPHLNILTDGGYLPDKKFEALKSRLRYLLGEPKLIVRKEYRATPAEMMHTVKYVCRATFRDRSWDYAMADELYKFQNGRSRGNFKGDAVWGNEDHEAGASAESRLMESKCHRCDGDLVWQKPESVFNLILWDAKPIGDTGFYELAALPQDNSVQITQEMLDSAQAWRESSDSWAREVGSDLGACFIEYSKRNHCGWLEDDVEVIRSGAGRLKCKNVTDFGAWE